MRMVPRFRREASRDSSANCEAVSRRTSDSGAGTLGPSVENRPGGAREWGRTETAIDQDPKDVVRLQATAKGVEGEAALRLDPGVRADAQHRTIDAALSTPLNDAAAQFCLVLAARPSAYAFLQPGKDDEGRTHFVVRGRAEGDLLVPAQQDPETSELAIRRKTAKRKRG
jgi:hypothetical protein